MRTLLLACAALLLASCLKLRAGTNALLQADSHLTRPDRVDATTERISTLRTLPGLSVGVFARDLRGARMMALAPDGAVLLTRPKEGDVHALRDVDKDGAAERRIRVLSGLDGVHGVAVHEGRVYLSTPTQVLVSDLAEGGALGEPTPLAPLPEGGRHDRRTQAVGPDGRLYVSVGSTCNACVEDGPEHAAILRMTLDGSGREIFARGLRNTIGFDFHPETDELWGMDHGSDHRGDEVPPEELNRVQWGKDYGWPWAYGNRIVDEEAPDPPTGTKAAHAATSEPMVLGYQAHAAPMAMIFLDRPLGPLGRGDALVAMHGSWNREEPVGYEVVAIRFENGRPTRFEPVLTGFLMPDGTQFGGSRCRGSGSRPPSRRWRSERRGSRGRPLPRGRVAWAASRRAAPDALCPPPLVRHGAPGADDPQFESRPLPRSTHLMAL
jgi:glucose/arabinose dehydrogenase